MNKPVRKKIYFSLYLYSLKASLCFSLFLLLAFVSPNNAYAWTNDEYKSLKLLANIETTLSTYNLITAKSLFDCGCSIASEKSEAPTVCKSSNTIKDFQTKKINYEGAKIDLKMSCLSKISEYQDTVTSLWEKYRLTQAVQKQNLKKAVFLKQKIELNNKVTVPLIEDESALIEGLNSDELRDLEFNLEEKIKELRTNLSHKPLERKPRWTEGMTEERAFQLNQETSYQIFVKKHIKELKEKNERLSIKLIERVPIINYLTRANINLKDILIGLSKIIINANDRLEKHVDLEKKITISQKPAYRRRHQSRYGNLSKGLKLMDSPLGIKYLPILLEKQESWDQEKITSVLTELSEKRKKQVFNKALIETGLSMGVIMSCFLPIPQLKIGVHIISKFVFSTSCMMGTSVSVNNYFLNEAVSSYETLFQNALSTPDGWNKLIEFSQIKKKEDEIRLIKLFYLLEVIPAYSLIKHLDKLI